MDDHWRTRRGGQLQILSIAFWPARGAAGARPLRSDPGHGRNRLALPPSVGCSAHEHPSLMSPDHAPPGNGLLLFFRVDDFDSALKRARALVTRFEEEPHVNPNTRTTEFSLRDPDGYYVTINALSAAVTAEYQQQFATGHRGAEDGPDRPRRRRRATSPSSTPPGWCCRR